MNTNNCKECNSTSLEKCLRIQCPHFMNIKRDENESKDVKAESEDKDERHNKRQYLYDSSNADSVLSRNRSGSSLDGCG